MLNIPNGVIYLNQVNIVPQLVHCVLLVDNKTIISLSQLETYYNFLIILINKLYWSFSNFWERYIIVVNFSYYIFSWQINLTQILTCDFLQVFEWKKMQLELVCHSITTNITQSRKALTKRLSLLN
ncbi:Hypothetical_protein [Hexamita inflata]|uniref:Hypothetical_protein n=1 Tax=Hexamita inflata TaxID=28002 RepID=A0ABP1HCK9_9EUKA